MTTRKAMSPSFSHVLFIFSDEKLSVPFETFHGGIRAQEEKMTS